ncbi:MarR family transcriptional regulator [Actinoplanes sp. NPDC051861]|uniref:MarR family winged helix-turn-helix transcriptional regulator n=1 Tax=Actinoplanes sp. NPDC051861 TaxID=3155170 RepID=UPI003418446C
MTPDESLARSPGGRELGYLVLQAGRIVQSAMEEGAVRAGMSPTDLLALYVLGEHEGLTGGALARLLSLPQSSITPLADRLESAGLIERERDETDRRRVWLCPTPQGEAVLRKAGSMARAAVRDALAPLTTGSAAALAALLDEVVEPWITEIAGNRVTRDEPA